MNVSRFRLEYPSYPTAPCKIVFANPYISTRSEALNNDILPFLLPPFPILVSLRHIPAARAVFLPIAGWYKWLVAKRTLFLPCPSAHRRQRVVYLTDAFPTLRVRVWAIHSHTMAPQQTACVSAIVWIVVNVGAAFPDVLNHGCHSLLPPVAVPSSICSSSPNTSAARNHTIRWL